MRSKQENKVQVSFKRRQYLAMVKLFWAVIPFGRKFIAMTKLQKTFHIIKFPVTFFLVLTIPVVNKSEPLNNWNRWLSIIHCVTAPVFASLATKVGLSLLSDHGPPAVIIFIIFGIILAVIVALTSSNDKIPFYHCIFAWAGFLLSVVWIYTIANEIVNLLQVFGVVVRLSDGILGLTLLAWGNSIQDTVTNLTMTRHGFPRMAVGACFGGPLLNLLIGVGLASIIKFISEGTIEFKLYFTQVEMVAGLFLLFSLASSLVVVMCLLNFKMRRLYSIYLFLLYIIFLVVAIIAELKLFTVDWDELTDF
jgi:sodium/potassium/calcium exchanger 6